MMKEAEILRSAASELGKYIDDVNAKLKAGIVSTDLDDPDYNDYQTPHELVVIAKQYEALQAELDAYKASVTELKIVINQVLDSARDPYECSEDFCYYVNEALTKTPAQSLADIQANAVNDLISEKSVNVNIEGTEWPVIYVEDTLSFINNLNK